MKHIYRKEGRRVRPHPMTLLALLIILGAVLAGLLVAYLPHTGARAASVNWPTFLGSNARTDYNSAETAINASTASHLNVQWSRNVAGRISTQPVVANGLLYWGSWDGVEHATNLTTGSDVWSVNLGQTSGSCDQLTYGVLSSSTIATITINGTPTSIDFVGGGKADLYALNASTGATIWHTSLASAQAHFSYSSTAFFNGSIYIGVSSLGDCPLSDGSMVQVNAVTGQIQHSFSTVSSGCAGASVWGSPTIDEASGKIYFVTGNGSKCSTSQPFAESIIELNAFDLSLVASWQVPASQAPGDSDFGSTPTLFQATINGSQRSLVGVPNKNGIYYAFDRTNISAGPIWEATLAVGGDSPEGGNGSIAASAFDGSRLYVAGGNTTIAGNSCAGSVQALNPATGSPLWQTCLSGPVLAPVMAVPGLVAVGSGQYARVVDATNGNILFSYNDNVSGSYFWSGATVSNGMLVQGTTGGTLYAFAAPSTSTPTPSPTQPTPTPSPTSTPPPNLQPGPVNKTWYFAEGRVGGGFTEYLSMDNPTSNACAVTITYLYTPDGGTAQVKTVSVTVAANTRYEEGVDGDLGTYPTGPGITDSAIVSVNTGATPGCTGIVAERPMYYNTQGNSLGANSTSDVPGVTHLGTTFYLADVAVGAQNGGFYSSFITILNPPNAQTANVTATYYTNGKAIGTDTAIVPGGTRGTIFPNKHQPALPAHVSVVVTSSQPVAVERPTYFSNVSEGNAGTVSGGADVIAVQSLSTDWLFAEGYTGNGFQENFVIANLDPAGTAATVTIKLEPQNGAAPTSYTIPVAAFSQVIWNVNAMASGQSLSAEITSSGAKIAVDREMFFHYVHNANGRSLAAMGGTDALGQVGPAAQSLYSFAEGYVNVNYDEWLTLQNPTGSSEVVWVTLYNALGRTLTFSVNVAPNSRATVDIVHVVLTSLYQNGDGYKGFEVAMTVQTTSTAGGPFVAERPMYSNVNGIQGGTDIIGYTGG